MLEHNKHAENTHISGSIQLIQLYLNYVDRLYRIFYIRNN